MNSEFTGQVLFRRITLRHWMGARRSTGLQIVILALGIAVFFSIRLANRAAVNSFESFTGMLHQGSDWQVSALAGELPDTTLGTVRAALGDLPVDMIPVLETTATLTRSGSETNENLVGSPLFNIVGLDLIAIQNPAHAAGENLDLFKQPANEMDHEESESIWQVLQNPRAVFVSAAMARRQHLQTKDPFRVVIDDQPVTLEVAGVIPEVPSRPSAPDNLMVMDLPALQRLAHRVGQVDRIEFTVPEGPQAEAQREALHTLLEQLGRDRWRIITQADRRAGAAMMTRAFRMNLNLLSMVALLVGMYLVFQSLDGAVVRRREEIGILRSLGVTEAMIHRAWLLEAALLGLIGGVLGALLGWGGAQLAVRFVGRTVNALYFSTSVQSASLSTGELLLALGISLAASSVAGWWPARQAARTPPAQILSRQTEAGGSSGAWHSRGLALAILGVSWILTCLPPLRLTGALRIPLGGYLAAAGLIVGGGLLCGNFLPTLARWARLVGRNSTGRFSAASRIALSHLAHGSSRHRLAAAGLLCAMAMAAGMIILVASFDGTMRGWIAHTFQADLYVTSAGAQSASSQNRIPPATWKHIAGLRDVTEINPIQAAEIQLNGISTMLVGVDVEFEHRHPNLTWNRRPETPDFFDDNRNAGLAIASESFCDRFRLRQGDTVRLPTPGGVREVRLVGVFSDYGNERGSLVISRRHFAEWFGDELASSLVLYVRPGADAEQVRAELAQAFPGLTVLTNRHLRTEVLRVFHQTFSVTYALELIGIVVAVTGLGMTLSSMLVDRRAELTTLRALGWRRDDLALAASLEGTLLAVEAVVAGSIVSVGLGWILIYIINKQSFGWTLQFAVPWRILVFLGVLVVGCGAVVAYLVGRWGSGLAADREE